jgi:hypothetical protein
VWRRTEIRSRIDDQPGSRGARPSADSRRPLPSRGGSCIMHEMSATSLTPTINDAADARQNRGAGPTSRDLSARCSGREQ